MKFARRFLCLVLIWVFTVPSSMVIAHGDGIDLTVASGPGPQDITLTWTGGTQPFDVFRFTQALSLLDPPNKLGSTSPASWVDTPPATDVVYYIVTDPDAGPIIQHITPTGSSFGDLITVYGSGFGTDPGAVKIRFSYVDGGESLIIDQTVYDVNETRIDLSIPMAMPNQINQVEVLVGAMISPAKPYAIGALPEDPTPGISGNETLALLDDIDLLMVEFDLTIDTWFLTTGAATQLQVDNMHLTVTQIQSALGQLRSDVNSRSALELETTDTIIGTPSFDLSRQRLQDAIAALSGSPLGSVLCEGQDLRDVVRDLVNVLNIVDDILSAVSTALDIACAAAILAAIFTLGTTSPLAVGLCAAAAAVDTIIVPIIDAISAASAAMDAIASAAPVDPVSGTYLLAIEHPLWGADPPVAYVEGNIPLEASVTSDFHNGRCEIPGGCDVNFDITIFSIDIPITVSVPHIVKVGLPLSCGLSFPDGPGGVAGYTDEGTLNDGATCLYTGADVNGPSWERGNYDVVVSSDCVVPPPSANRRTHLLVSGPLLTSANPGSMQLGDSFHLLGQYMPPNAISAANISFEVGVSTGPTITQADDYTLVLPDTDGTSAVQLRVQGRSSNPLPVTVLPPLIDSLLPGAPFEGERVTVTGTGFAQNPANNQLTVNDVPVPTLSPAPDTVTFEVPPGSGGQLLKLTAVNVHHSNTIPLGLAAWGPAATLSHASRNADNPVLVAHTDGTVGVTWVDRHATGGYGRLLFTDAAPGDATFRQAIEITDDMLGPHTSPQTVDMAIAPDGRFHIVWVDEAAALQTVSFAKGTTPTSIDWLEVAVPDGIFRDPRVATRPNGSIHIVVIDASPEAIPHDMMIHTESTDGGLTFEPAMNLYGPEDTPPGTGFDRLLFHLGTSDLTYAGGRLWLAFTRGCKANCNSSLPNIEGRGAFVASSENGEEWGDEDAVAINQADLPFPGSSVSGVVMHQFPVVSADALGALAAWQAPTLGAHAVGRDYATISLRASSQSAVSNFLSTTMLTLSPDGVGYQNDNGRPALIHYGEGSGFLTALAWSQRIPGTSPDLISGVPRVQFNRSSDRLASLALTTNLEPSIAPADTTTITDKPSLAVDATGVLHMVWLEGPEGNRVVRYANTGTPFGDAPSTNPPVIPTADRQFLIYEMADNRTEAVAIAEFHGTLIFDPVNFFHELRWIGTSTVIHEPHTASIGPSVGPDGKIIYYGSQGLLGPTRVSLNGDLQLVASDDFAMNEVLSELTRPVAVNDGAIIGARSIGGGQIQIVEVDPSTGQWSTIGSPFADGPGRLGVSYTGTYVAYDDPVGEVVVLERVTGTEVARFVNARDFAWAFDANKLAFVESRTVPCAQDAVMEATFPGGTAVQQDLTSCSGEMFRPAYAPDGSDMAFACTLCGDASADIENAMVIKTLSNGICPRNTNQTMFAPVWAPDSTRIALFQYDSALPASESMALQVWTLGDPAVDGYFSGPMGTLPAGFPYEQPRMIWVRFPQ